MSILGLKTPVSCLQEYLVSEKKIPQYELVYNGVGTHNPEFTYRVQVGALWEEGTGKSKQEAKHRAAEKMLKSLKVVIPEGEKEEEKELEPLGNYVGQLKEFCRNLHHPEPNYYLEEAAGPSHCKIFKMVCCVSQLQDFGISKTKKQAKHQAAYKMLQRLKEMSSVRADNPLFDPKTQTKLVSSSLTDEEIFERFNAFKRTNPTTIQDPVAFYKDNHNAYMDLPEISPTLSEVLKKNTLTYAENALGLMEDIAKELGVDLTTVVIPSKSPEINFTVMTLSVFPPAAGIGSSNKNAAFNLLNSLMVLCK